MLQVGNPVPDFELEFVEAKSGQTGTFRRSRDQTQWLLVLYYPRDFSFVCPTEITAFSDHAREFADRNCDVLAVSIDPVATHQAWLKTPIEQGGIGSLGIKLGSDVDGELAQKFGIWNEPGAVPNRALMLIDPAGVLQYLVVHNLAVGRSVEETLRVIQALQTGGLCPAGWTDSDGTLETEKLLTPGRVLGHYRIEQTLGSGTFGTVFQAWDLRLERPVALKVLKRAHDDSRTALLDEARTVSALAHPYICTIYAVEELDHLPVIVMQYIEGDSLAFRLSSGNLDRDTARQMTSRIAEGLSAAHECGVVHGDLKPANILIRDDARPVIVDFGMTASHKVKLSTLSSLSGGKITPDIGSLEATLTWERATDSSGSSPSKPASEQSKSHDEPGQTHSWYSSTARLVGTPAYMSPEQARGVLPGPSSDVFALGLIYGEMLLGDRILGESDLPSILHSLQTDNLAHRVLQLLGDKFPKACLAMLHPDPADRPTARQVMAALGQPAG